VAVVSSNCCAFAENINTLHMGNESDTSGVSDCRACFAKVSCVCGCLVWPDLSDIQVVMHAIQDGLKIIIDTWAGASTHALECKSLPRIQLSLSIISLSDSRSLQICIPLPLSRGYSIQLVAPMICCLAYMFLGQRRQMPTIFLQRLPRLSNGGHGGFSCRSLDSRAEKPRTRVVHREHRPHS
jgi:hypothetical protein